MHFDDKTRLNFVQLTSVELADEMELAVKTCNLEKDLQTFLPLIHLFAKFNSAYIKLIPNWKDFFEVK